jgi:hypothetical protein
LFLSPAIIYHWCRCHRRSLKSLIHENLKSKISCQTPFKYRSETNSISLQFVKIEAKMKLVRSSERSKTKQIACSLNS